jgi:outer membrane protein assembly factor BamB
VTETLEDDLRRATRNFTARLPMDQVLTLGHHLARELARAHAESPPRHPAFELAQIGCLDGKPRLEGGSSTGETAEDLFRLGTLLHWLATGTQPDVSWRLDGPPVPETGTLAHRDALATLAAPRRDRRFATAVAAAEALEAALAPAAETPSPWPLFRGDAARTGARPAETTVGRLEPVWETLAGGAIASPVLITSFVLCPTTDGRLLFLDRSAGRVVHEMRLGSAIESSPALAGPVLYVGTDDGNLVAVDAVAGKERFRAALGQLVRSSPLPAGDRVLVGVVEGKSGGGLVCVEAEKGKLVWKAKLAAVFSSPALAGDRALVGCDDGSLRAVDLAKGSVLWSFALGAKVRATPAVAGDVAVVGDFGGRLAAVRLADGSAVWTVELGHPVYSSPCIAAGLVVVGCNEGHVHGVDLGTGAARFQVATRGPVVSSAASLGDRFLIGSTDGDLYLIDAAGQLAQRTTLARTGIQSAPATDGSLVYVASGSGLHALRATA